MNTLQRRCGRSLLRAGLLSAFGQAWPANIDAPTAAFTPQEAIVRLFEVEGNSPFASPYDGTLAFSALASKFSTANGHGYRNELKIAQDQRRPAARTREHFSAVVTPTLPAGAKTIVAQYHVEGLNTILKVYVQDTGDSHALDGRAGNGVFDIIVRILGSQGKEAETALGTVRSGERFVLRIDFENGIATVRASTAANGARQAGPTEVMGDGRDIYFKFGDYAQALDPLTHKPTSSPAAWDAWFRQNHIDSSLIRFSQSSFVRD